MKQFCINSIKQLNDCPLKEWAVLYVSLKMEFFKKFQKGLVCSTYHGLDFFNNLLNCLNGSPWNPLDGEGKSIKGEYESNFRKLVEIGKAETA